MCFDMHGGLNRAMHAWLIKGRVRATSTLAIPEMPDRECPYKNNKRKKWHTIPCEVIHSR